MRGTDLTTYILDRVAIDNGCWEWLGAHYNSGYGITQYYVKGGTMFKEAAHRSVWKMMRGPIPEDMQLHHKCRNRGCVNPSHLSLVTQGEHIAIEPQGASQWQRLKTRCPKGHPLSGDNLYIRPSKLSRECQICRKEERHNRYVASRRGVRH